MNSPHPTHLLALVALLLAFSAGVLARPVITQQPVDFTTVTHSEATFMVAATGTGHLTYQWRKSGQLLVGATAATLTLADLQTDDSGSYEAEVSDSTGSVSSRSATLYVVFAPQDPWISIQPMPLTVMVGQPMRIAVGVLGSLPMAFQWYRDGIAIPGANESSYRTDSAQLGAAGSYTVTVTNRGGTATSNPATLRVNPVDGPPQFLEQPRSQILTPGFTANFAVTVSGTLPLSYQWSKNGVPLTGATTPALAIANAQTADAGNYTVTVRNALGSITSGGAQLSFYVPPVIHQQPASQLVLAGGSASLAVSASGAATAYQWRKNGLVIGGATDSSLSICAALSNDAGRYSVVVSNAAGAVVSSEATVQVSVAQAPETESRARMINLSTRGWVGNGHAILVAGLVITGDEPKAVLVRAAGPALAEFGVEGVLARPSMTLMAGGEPIASNTGWTSAANRDEVARVAARVGAFPFAPASADSALLVVLRPGLYTVHVSGADGGTGIALVESYAVN